MVHDITTHRNIFDSLIENYTAEDIIRALSPCFTEERIKRIAGTIENRMSSIHVAIEEPYDIHNALAVVRSAEALGVNTVHIINPIIRKRTSGKKTMQGTDRWAECYRHPSLEAFSSASRGLIIAGACVDG
ncbi:MAG: hypothetical protein HN685_02420, partial [Waddliaceae bacterium]|nr:hypothetical protein [Waddliaceae bacterium]